MSRTNVMTVILSAMQIGATVSIRPDGDHCQVVISKNRREYARTCRKNNVSIAEAIGGAWERFLQECE